MGVVTMFPYLYIMHSTHFYRPPLFCTFLLLMVPSSQRAHPPPFMSFKNYIREKMKYLFLIIENIDKKLILNCKTPKHNSHAVHFHKGSCTCGCQVSLSLQFFANIYPDFR